MQLSDSWVSTMPQKTQHDVLTVIKRIGSKVQHRFIEWVAGFQFVGTGLILLYSPNSFDLSPAYLWMRSIGPDHVWGPLLLILGLSRIIGLIINGSMERVTPWIRSICAMAGFATFSMISVSLYVSWLLFDSPLYAGLAMYIPCAVAELVAIYFSIRDTRIYQHADSTAT